MRLELTYSEISADERLLELRHHLIEKMGSAPECLLDVDKLLGEVNDLLANCIYATEDREAIVKECLQHWKQSLVPHFTELCVETVRLKLRDSLSLDSLIDIRFALESGIKHRIPWDDLLAEEIGPAITKSDLSPYQMRHALWTLRVEYESALRIAML
jgi:hypothetical protein